MSESKWDSDERNGGAKSDGEGWDHIDFREIELGAMVGGGGVGVIYDGYWRGQPVALKTLFDTRVSEDLKREYMDELLVMSKVKHSNIVKFLGACMTPPNLCFVMEKCECSLYDLLHVQRLSLTEKEKIQMAADIASAMEYLHAQRPIIIHRDLKSHNILRSFNGSMKLCDFGLVNIKNTTAGTPAYMAPELLENRSFNKSVDVYAFGVLMWEIFAEELPFKMNSVEEIRRRVCAGDRPRIPTYGCPTRIAALIRQCWSPKPEERPAFTEIVDELLDIEDNYQAESKHTEKLKDHLDELDNLMSFK